MTRPINKNSHPIPASQHPHPKQSISSLPPPHPQNLRTSPSQHMRNRHPLPLIIPTLPSLPLPFSNNFARDCSSLWAGIRLTGGRSSLEVRHGQDGVWGRDLFRRLGYYCYWRPRPFWPGISCRGCNRVRCTFSKEGMGIDFGGLI